MGQGGLADFQGLGDSLPDLPSGDPRPEEVEAADPAFDVEHLSGDVESGMRLLSSVLSENSSSGMPPAVTSAVL